MSELKENLKFEGLSGPCFDSPPHELMATKHWIFSLLPFCRPEIIQIWKWRVKMLLGLSNCPFAKDRKNILFIHIPKNAGQSFIEAIYGRKGRSAHVSAQFFEAISPRAFERALKVAVIRDPNQRFVSAVNYNKYTSPHEANREFAEEYLDYPNMRELVDAIERDDQLYNRLIFHMHFRRQVGYVCDRRGRVKVDLLISMDALDAGLAELSKLGGHEFSLEHKNPSPNREKGFQLTGRLREYYEPDFRLWELVSSSEFGFIWVNEEKKSACSCIS